MFHHILHRNKKGPREMETKRMQSATGCLDERNLCVHSRGETKESEVDQLCDTTGSSGVESALDEV